LFTHTHTTEIKTAAGKVLTDARTYQGEGEENFSGVAPNGATTGFVLGIDVSALVAWYVVSDQDVTLKTNSSGAPDETIALTAGQAKIWNTDRGTNPLATDITELFFQNAGDDDANIKAGFLLNL
jgi:hypothetical protein